MKIKYTITVELIEDMDEGSHPFESDASAISSRITERQHELVERFTAEVADEEATISCQFEEA